MIIDITPAFANGNQGLTVFNRSDEFMVSVKTDQGGFRIGYGPTPEKALNDALKIISPARVSNEDILGDLM